MTLGLHLQMFIQHSVVFSGKPNLRHHDRMATTTRAKYWHCGLVLHRQSLEKVKGREGGGQEVSHESGCIQHLL